MMALHPRINPDNFQIAGSSSQYVDATVTAQFFFLSRSAGS